MREFKIYTTSSVADPEHEVVVGEVKKNGDVVAYESFAELEAAIAEVKHLKAFNAGYNAGYSDGSDAGYQAGANDQRKEAEAYPDDESKDESDEDAYDEGYDDGFDKGVHRVLEILGITDEEFTGDQQRLKDSVTFYRGLKNLGLDVNKLSFYENTDESERLPVADSTYWQEP